MADGLRSRSLVIDGIGRAVVETLIEQHCIEIGEAIDAHLLMRGCLGGAVGELLDLFAADLEGVDFRAFFHELVGHAGRVIDDDDVRGSLSGRPGADEAGDEEAGQQHQQAAQRQQDHLFDDKAAAIAFLRLEQKLHRRPANALEAHAVDQVDEIGALTSSPPAAMYQGCRNRSMYHKPSDMSPRISR